MFPKGSELLSSARNKLVSVPVFCANFALIKLHKLIFLIEEVECEVFN
jgi:hypothetical protein